MFLAGPGDTVGMFRQPPGLMAWRRATHLARSVDTIEIDSQHVTASNDGYARAINSCPLEASALHRRLADIATPPVLVEAS